MKALTLWRPWAQAIIYGPKRIENRSWRPVKWMIGERIAIHAGKKYDEDGEMWMLEYDLYRPENPDMCACGILGTAVITDCVSRSDDSWFCGPFGWVLDDIIALPSPIPCRGAQGLWDVPDDVLKEMP